MEDLILRSIRDVTPASNRGATDRHEDFIIVALSRTGPDSEESVSIHITNQAARELKGHLDRLLLG
jgi:hypothetical protein